jgi:hypothetical protein
MIFPLSLDRKEYIEVLPIKVTVHLGLIQSSAIAFF